MPLVGYSDLDLAAAHRKGERLGRAAGEASVYKMWCWERLTSGKEPPMFCPVEVVEQVKREIEAKRPLD
jgi:hypothetical protein